MSGQYIACLSARLFFSVRLCLFCVCPCLSFSVHLYDFVSFSVPLSVRVCLCLSVYLCMFGTCLCLPLPACLLACVRVRPCMYVCAYGLDNITMRDLVEQIPFSFNATIQYGITDHPNTCRETAVRSKVTSHFWKCPRIIRQSQQSTLHQISSKQQHS